METEKQPIYLAQHSSTINYDLQLVLGVSAITIGFCLGSGRWEWLGRGASRLGSNIAQLLATSAIQAIEKRNPKLYSEFSSNEH